MTKILILPGINNSGSEHWQTRWEQQNPHYTRIIQDDWDHPVCTTWAQRLEETIVKMGSDTVLVAHSLACLMVAHWANTTQLTLQGAFMVSVPDPNGSNFPSEAKGFSPLPTQPFSFPSLIVASTNDPYGTIEHSKQCAQYWGSDWISVGALGHINASSGLGYWSQGQQLLEQFLKVTQRQ
ncbi:MAG: alpha/beta hydrolase [Thiofilum sp.]|uniref:RBBP9/YdeN family alpha/beta hydrolase n=1 Tax=Thiofilum sp. TaxID=2212733 RepID=UPI0025F88FC0|nr:alpha/beta hydrolase [Thiofilum sp.]MBK8454704.1 serine hydrolase family protein [Thiofilum sp.]